MAQRAKRLTKKEKKALDPRGGGPSGGGHHHHIHCTACGLHLDEEQFGGTPPEAVWLTCDHGSTFASCTACEERSRVLIAEHDRTNQPVKTAPAWH